MLFVSSNRRTLHQNKLLELGLAFNPNQQTGMSTKIGPSKTRIIKTSGQNWNGNISYFFLNTYFITHELSEKEIIICSPEWKIPRQISNPCKCCWQDENFSNFSCRFLNPNYFFQFKLQLFKCIKCKKPPGTS